MAEWKNRIVGHGEMPAKDFLAHPMNFRVHPQSQQSALQGSLDELGWIDDVLVNVDTNHVINGHLRISLALRQGDETPVPVTYVSLSPSEELTALATFDPITALAVADKEKLDALLRDTKPADAALQQFLSELAAKEGLYQGNDYDGDGLMGSGDVPRASLSDRFLVPPFSVLDARQGYWQERKRAWLALGIQSELGRGDNALGFSEGVNERHGNGTGPYTRETTLGAIPSNERAILARSGKYKATPGGSLRPAASLGPDGKTRRGDGHGRPIDG